MRASSKLAPIQMVNRTTLPPGSSCGQMCTRSLRVTSGDVTSLGVPPLAEIFQRPEVKLLVNTIVSSEPHEPPSGEEVLHKVTGNPPPRETFLSLLSSVKKATHWPSGEKNGFDAPSVPGIATAFH